MSLWLMTNLLSIFRFQITRPDPQFHHGLNTQIFYKNNFQIYWSQCPCTCLIRYLHEVSCPKHSAIITIIIFCVCVVACRQYYLGVKYTYISYYNNIITNIIVYFSLSISVYHNFRYFNLLSQNLENLTLQPTSCSLSTVVFIFLLLSLFSLSLFFLNY